MTDGTGNGRTPSVNPETLAYLDELQEPGQPDFLADLIGSYLREAPARLADIQAAIAAGDMPRLARAGHRLKGSSANLGAETLADLCKDVEIKAATDQVNALQQAWERLQSEYGKVDGELRAALRGRVPRP